MTDLAGTRIWGGIRQPPEEAQYVPAQGGAIVFEFDGGRGNYGHTLQNVRYMLKCYGCDREQAGELYNVAADLLFHTNRSGERMAHCVMATRGESLPIGRREPDTDWPHILIFFRATMKAQAS